MACPYVCLVLLEFSVVGDSEASWLILVGFMACPYGCLRGGLWLALMLALNCWNFYVVTVGPCGCFFGALWLTHMADFVGPYGLSLCVPGVVGNVPW